MKLLKDLLDLTEINVFTEAGSPTLRPSKAESDEKKFTRPAPFTDVSEEEIIKLISKKSFVKHLATMKRTFNAKYFNIEGMSGVAFYLAKRKTHQSMFGVYDKDATLLHAAVYWKEKLSKDGQHGGRKAAAIVTCVSQDGKIWQRESIESSSNGYYNAKNPYDSYSRGDDVKFLKAFLADGTEVESTYKIENQR